MRTELLSAITTAISTLTQFAVSQELPWSQNNLPLFRKNLKKVYVDHERIEETMIYEVLNGSDVYQDDYICSVYLAVDAKNPPSQTESVISRILGCKSSTGIISFGQESDYAVSLEEDVLIYTFEFRLNVATT
jgi:hypothetical protein